MYRKLLNKTILLLVFMMLSLSGCSYNISIESRDSLTGEDYPEAGKYQTGSFSYNADEVKAIEVYWRSGEITLTESENSQLQVRESGTDLPENVAMHYFLDHGTLKIRFCASGAKIQVDTLDKQLFLEIPEGIDLSLHTTSAPIKAVTLTQKNLLIAALSGSTELGSVTAESIDLSSSSGSVCADSISAQTLTCSATSGSLEFGAVSADQLDCNTSSGFVSMGSVTSKTLGITTTSGNVELFLTSPFTATICTTSGSVDTTLANGGAEVLYTSNGGNLLTDRSYQTKGDLYVLGNGESTLTVETSSGDLTIH